MMLPAKHNMARPALSLLEVLIALAVFLIALVGIGQLITFGSDRAVEVQLQARATQLCQSKMAEVIAGVVPLSSQSKVSFDEDPDWQWSLDAENGSVANLWTVTVTVSRRKSEGSTVESSLSQWILDPSIRGNSSDQPPPSTSGSGSSGSSGSSGGGMSKPSTSGSSSPAMPAGGNTSRPTGGSSKPAGGGSGRMSGAAPAKGGG